MISSLHGTVLQAAAESVIVEVSGVGFSVAVPPDVARTAREGEQIRLHTHLIVRDDALSLVGFADRDELEVFGVLLGVSGVGPKSALGILSNLTIDQIAQAVDAEDDKPFRKVSGIGPKTAKLIVVQLHGRLAAPTAPASASGEAPSSVASQVIAAVAGLGWPERVAADAVERVAETASEADLASMQALLRLTLAALGPAKKEAPRV
ncbi:Holliday junction ATP-dependent DNA helicase RuvA [Microbacterium faecale]|uniref:Holliday junction branch migration complex subunit RuvA n=1 Tax=Microbacterium faecale TaxID=1804630 RepID=A0A917DHE7_9MICO|nr:Holliday junction branch migration protein RuvA [Microbacterium faecale]GGD37787.1 Holliday junction ATP-dependent DNA helicase RuvA [Microbacterium faecale]